jgi:hypothetical protein
VLFEKVDLQSVEDMCCGVVVNSSTWFDALERQEDLHVVSHLTNNILSNCFGIIAAGHQSFVGIRAESE